jgi:hypothetical protein
MINHLRTTMFESLMSLLWDRFYRDIFAELNRICHYLIISIDEIVLKQLHLETFLNFADLLVRFVYMRILMRWFWSTLSFSSLDSDISVTKKIDMYAVFLNVSSIFLSFNPSFTSMISYSSTCIWLSEVLIWLFERVRSLEIGSYRRLVFDCNSSHIWRYSSTKNTQSVMPS